MTSKTLLLLFIHIIFIVESRLIDTEENFNPKIIGGSNADIIDFPYQLSLRYKEKHGCGASIISPNWALTASHCLEDFKQADVKDLIVVAGSTYRVSGGTKYSISEFIMHPNYDNNTADFDFALLKISNSFQIGREGINTVKLTDVEPKQGQFGNITGWGVLHNGVTNLPNTLQKLSVPIVNKETCKKNYEGLNVITERMICAGFPEGKKDGCVGDSGGPLVINNVQVGVISFGYGCAQPNKPGIYANVAYARNWIKQITGV